MGILSMESLNKARQAKLKAEQDAQKAAEELALKEQELREANEQLALEKELELLAIKRKAEEELKNIPQPTIEQLEEARRKQELIEKIELATNMQNLADLEVLRKLDELDRAKAKAEEAKNKVEELKKQI